MHSRFASVLCEFFLAALPAFAAQFDHYGIVELSPSDGYPTQVNSICVEDRGYVWMGSNDGLYRVENHHVTRFTVDDPTEGYLLPGNDVRKIVRDRRKNLWILTDKGMIGLRPNESGSIHESIDYSDHPIMAYSALADENGVYFGGENKIWRYDYSNGHFYELVRFVTEHPYQINEMYFAYGDVIMLINSYGENVRYFHTSKRIIEEPGSEWKSDYCSAFVDSQARFWICKFNCGIEVYDHYGWRTKLSTENSGLSCNTALCYAEYNGKMLVGTDGGGINIIDPVTKDVQVLKHNPKSTRTIPGDIISTISVDGQGQIWVGRARGGAFVITRPWISSYRTDRIYPRMAPEGLTSIYQDPSDGRIWLGTNGSGLFSFNPDDEKFTSYPSTNGLHIYSIARISKGELALSCTSRGIYEFNTQTLEVCKSERITDIDNYYLYNGESASLCNDTFGRLLCFGYDISRYDPQKGTLERFPAYESCKAKMHAVFGSKGMFVCDANHLYKWEESNASRLECILSMDGQEPIRSAVMGYRNEIWLACGNDVLRFDLETKTLEQTGIPLDSKPMSLLCDNHGRLWIGTRAKLYVYFIASHNFLCIGKSRGGIENEYFANAKILCDNGDIFLGGKDALLHIKGNISFPAGKTPEICVSSLEVDGKYLSIDGKVTVPNVHKNIWMRFFAQSDDILVNPMFTILVEGPRGSYTKVTLDPELSFSKLQPGQYKISAKATTLDGRWTDYEEVISFKIRRPWYQRWWSITLEVDLMLLLTFILLKIWRNNEEYESLKSADEERMNFLVNVNHELRTPLTLIQGRLKRMIRTRTPNDLDYYDLKVIDGQVNRMNYLMNTILTVDKISTKPDAIKFDFADMNDHISELIDDFTPEAASRNIEIVKNFDINVRMVKCDVEKCRIVFENIMMNAIGHAPDKSKIFVSTEDLPEIGRMRISIADEGPGIQGSEVESLFLKYYKTTEEKSGFGIGLSYAKKIIDLHNGSIGAYNNVGRGATFWFELPYLQS